MHPWSTYAMHKRNGVEYEKMHPLGFEKDLETEGRLAFAIFVVLVLFLFLLALRYWCHQYFETSSNGRTQINLSTRDTDDDDFTFDRTNRNALRHTRIIRRTDYSGARLSVDINYNPAPPPSYDVALTMPTPAEIEDAPPSYTDIATVEQMDTVIDVEDPPPSYAEAVREVVTETLVEIEMNGVEVGAVGGDVGGLAETVITGDDAHTVVKALGSVTVAEEVNNEGHDNATVNVNAPDVIASTLLAPAPATAPAATPIIAPDLAPVPVPFTAPAPTPTTTPAVTPFTAPELTPIQAPSTAMAPAPERAPAKPLGLPRNERVYNFQEYISSFDAAPRAVNERANNPEQTNHINIVEGSVENRLKMDDDDDGLWFRQN